jgi:molecular chaperone DnaJ
MVDDEVFQTLGVAPGADAETVKQAYRKIAHETHPDRPGSDEAARARFEQASRAYATWLAAQPEAPQPPPPQEPGEEPPAAAKFGSVEDIFATFGDLFGDMFGGDKAARRGPSLDLRQDLKLTESDAKCGVKKDVVVKRGVPCKACEGTGSRDGKLTPCATCAGKGKKTFTQGFFMIQKDCGDCAGRGSRAETPCPACERGLVMRDETLTITVPPGVTAGQALRIPGKGHESTSGAKPGHLYLVVAITPTALVRKGDHVECELPIDVRQFLVGGRVTVDTLTGTTTVRVRPWPRDRTAITLPELGYPRAPDSEYRGDMTRGDQRVIVRVPPDVRAYALKAVAGVAGVIALLVGLALL